MFHDILQRKYLADIDPPEHFIPTRDNGSIRWVNLVSRRIWDSRWRSRTDVPPWWEWEELKINGRLPIAWEEIRTIMGLNTEHT